MIRSEHAKDDFTVLENKIKEGKVTLEDVAKVVITLGKLLLSVRSNQVTQMKAQGVELRKPVIRTEEKKEVEE